MLRVTEFLDIKKISGLRQAALGRGLDGQDSLSWHAALFDGDALCGAGRLYRRGEDIVIDSLALTSARREYREILFRTILLKAVNLAPERIFAPEETPEYLSDFGFKERKGAFFASPAEVVFPSLCGGKGCGGSG